MTRLSEFWCMSITVFFFKGGPRKKSAPKISTWLQKLEANIWAALISGVLNLETWNFWSGSLCIIDCRGENAVQTPRSSIHLITFNTIWTLLFCIPIQFTFNRQTISASTKQFICVGITKLNSIFINWWTQSRKTQSLFSNTTFKLNVNLWGEILH